MPISHQHRRCSLFAFLLATLAVSFACLREARADAPEPPIRLVTFGDPLPLETLRGELMRELHRSVRIAKGTEGASEADGGAPEATLTVTWHPDERELAVAFDEPGRGTVSRIVVASGEAEETARVAALLASSLIRNEVEAMLGKRRESSPPAPAPVPPTPSLPEEPAPAPVESWAAAAERNGGIHPLVWAGSLTYANVGVKFATSHFYAALTGHVTWLPEEEVGESGGKIAMMSEGTFLGAGVLVGWRISVEHGFSTDMDVGLAYYPTQTLAEETIWQPRARLLGVGEVGEHFRMFAGVGATVTVRSLKRSDLRATEATLAPEFLAGVEF